MYSHVNLFILSVLGDEHILNVFYDFECPCVKFASWVNIKQNSAGVLAYQIASKALDADSDAHRWIISVAGQKTIMYLCMQCTDYHCDIFLLCQRKWKKICLIV